MDIFTGISSRNKGKILKMLEATTFTFNVNDSISNSIKWNNMIGIIIQGYIQIIRIDYDGNRTILEELGDGDVFGTILDSLKNSEYEVIAKEDTELIVIDYPTILSETNNKYPYYNKFLRNLLEIVTNKMIERNERIEILTKKNIRDRLLEYFQIITNKSGIKVINLKMNYTELADFLSVDRSAMTRILKNLEEEGFIKRNGKKITLLY